MSKHLNNKEITGYRQALLLPSELLTVDSHLADCAQCRGRIRQNQDLTVLYESFFEPLEEFAANGSKDTDSGLGGKWRRLKKFRFFSVVTLLINRQPQVALMAAVVLMIGGLWIFWQKSAPPANEFLAGNNREEDFSLNNSASRLASTGGNEEKNESDKTPEIDKNSNKSGLQVVKPAKVQALLAKKETSGKPQMRIEISELEMDNSRTLSAAGGSNSDLNSSPPLRVGKEKQSSAIDFSTVEDADEYEIYLAEMPRFVTVSREKVKNKKWIIPNGKLKAGQNYVLQITALKNGQAIQSVKKMIRAKAVGKTN